MLCARWFGCLHRKTPAGMCPSLRGSPDIRFSSNESKCSLRFEDLAWSGIERPYRPLVRLFSSPLKVVEALHHLRRRRTSPFFCQLDLASFSSSFVIGGFPPMKRQCYPTLKDQVSDVLNDFFWSSPTAHRAKLVALKVAWFHCLAMSVCMRWPCRVQHFHCRTWRPKIAWLDGLCVKCRYKTRHPSENRGVTVKKLAQMQSSKEPACGQCMKKQTGTSPVVGSVEKIDFEVFRSSNADTQDVFCACFL